MPLTRSESGATRGLHRGLWLAVAQEPLKGHPMHPPTTPILPRAGPLSPDHALPPSWVERGKTTADGQRGGQEGNARRARPPTSEACDDIDGHSPFWERQSAW